eukprot:TRINITY_DN13973_c0_g1_i1.p1 TRINITY_DN13973_c0_g1~~TRINITY_DN13973_c0_g1_i1.p1  ORF type:complete len:102 (-),score=5.68 TRINITY_DN13973_c0_g1_i1:2-307(-)
MSAQPLEPPLERLLELEQLPGVSSSACGVVATDGSCRSVCFFLVYTRVSLTIPTSWVLMPLCMRPSPWHELSPASSLRQAPLLDPRMCLLWLVLPACFLRI